MLRSILCLLILLPASSVYAQLTRITDRPKAPPNVPTPTAEQARVFITDSHSWEVRGGGGGSSGSGFGGASSGGARPQTAEIIKTFGQRCPSVVINDRVQVSDYVVELDHEGGKSFLAHKDKIAVFVQTSGDSIFSKSTLSLGGSVQDACDAILKDWGEHSTELRAALASEKAPTFPGQQTSQTALGRARVSVTSTPEGADIEINGSFFGNTPSTIDLPLGDQNITIKKKGFNPWTRKIKLTGGSISVSANLDAAP